MKIEIEIEIEAKPDGNKAKEAIDNAWQELTN